MRFDIYGRYELEVIRESDRWSVYRLEGGRRRPEEDLTVPSDLKAEEVQGYLDDLLHEFARPGSEIERLD